MGIIEDISAFIDTYFLSESGYNIFNTFVYAFLALILTYLLLRFGDTINERGKMRWKEEFIPLHPDPHFWIAVMPYILLAGSLRVLNDTKILPTRILVTPYIFFVVIIIALTSVILSIIIGQEKGYDWRRIFFGIGLTILILSILPLIVLIKNPIGGIQVGVLIVGWIALFMAFRRWIVNNEFLTSINITVLSGQMFDACATYVALVFYAYEEKHILPGFLMDILGPITFFPMKLIVTLAAIYAIELLEDKDLTNWLKLLVFLFGTATGFRDFLRIITLS